MRLFVAVNLPGAEKERIRDAMAQLRAADLPFRWVNEDALHLTLAFLGEVAEERVEELMRALNGVARRSGPFPIRLGAVGAFPNLRRPRVLWLGVSNDGALERLQSETASVLDPLGFPREQRAYSPHLTLARARNDAPRNMFAALATAVDGIAYQGIVQVKSIDLMRSHLGRAGARYEKIGGAELGDASPVSVVN